MTGIEEFSDIVGAGGLIVAALGDQSFKFHLIITLQPPTVTANDLDTVVVIGAVRCRHNHTQCGILALNQKGCDRRGYDT